MSLLTLQKKKHSTMVGTCEYSLKITIAGISKGGGGEK